MQFLIYLAVMVLTMIISDLTRPVPKAPNRPGLDEFQFPTADPSRKIPMIWGKPLISGPNVTWYGDLRTTKITKKVKGMFSSKKQTIGYKFYAGMHLAICRGKGDVRLLKITVQETEVWKGNLASGRGRISKPTIFGGDESEGGIEGDFDWCPGGPTQGQNSYLMASGGMRSVFSGIGFGSGSKLGDLVGGLAATMGSNGRPGPTVPAYRSSARLVWRQGYLGNSKYIKEWAVQPQRLPNNISSAYYSIDGESNPAEILYEILIDEVDGANTSPAEIDFQSFLTAARILHGEKLGLSLSWDGSKTLDDLRADILSHIDGAMFRDVYTRQWKLILNRAPSAQELANAITLDESNCELETFSRPASDELVNEVQVVWTESGSPTKWPAVAQELGMYHGNGRQFISVTNTYQGVTSYTLASTLAARDLRVLGNPLVKITLKANRIAHNLTPMQRVKFSWKYLGVTEIVCTVLAVDYGTLDNPEITIDLVQDIFGVGTGIYSEGGSGSWVPPPNPPMAPTKARMEFSPFWTLLAQPGEFSHPEAAVPLLMAQPANGGQVSYDVQYSDPDTGGAFADNEYTQAFTPTGEVAYDYLETPAHDTSGTLIVRNLNGIVDVEAATPEDISNLGEGLIVIDNEWMAITHAAILDNGDWRLSVQRGLIDTTITRHLAGATVWFIGEGVGITDTDLHPFRTGQYRARLRSVALGGTMEESGSPILSITSVNNQDQRPRKPYPPRDLRINDNTAPFITANQDLRVTWRERNRFQESRIEFQTSTFNPPQEPGVRYRAYLYDSNGALLTSSGNITVPAYTFRLQSLLGGLPPAGYVQVESNLIEGGSSDRVTIWFALSTDFKSVADQAPQRLLEEAGPSGAWAFWRMGD